jgi:hypothetical protein
MEPALTLRREGGGFGTVFADGFDVSRSLMWFVTGRRLGRVGGVL